MTKKTIRFAEKTLSIALCAALVSLSAGHRAHATVARVVIGQTGPAATMPGVPGALGLTSNGLSATSVGAAPTLTGALPTVSLAVSPSLAPTAAPRAAASIAITRSAPAAAAAPGAIVETSKRTPAVTRAAAPISKAVPAAAKTRKAAASKLTKMTDTMSPQLERAAQLGSVGTESSHGIGSRIADVIMGRRTPRTSGGVVAAAPGSPMKSLSRLSKAADETGTSQWAAVFGRDSLANAGRLYARAHKEAKKWADSVGKGEATLRFGGATASMPIQNGDHWKFTFYLMDAEGAAQDSVLIEFSRVLGMNSGPFETRMHVYHDVTPASDQPLLSISPARFAEEIKFSAAEAYDRIGSVLRGTGYSVELRLVQKGEDGPRELWYHFFDDAGSEMAVSARTGQINVVRKAVAKSREQKKEQWQVFKKLRDLDSWMGENIPLYDTAKWIALLGVGLWLLDMAFGFGNLLPRAVGLGLMAVGGTFTAQNQKGKGAIQKLKEIDSWLDDNIPFYGIAKWIAALSIGMWLLDLAFGFGDLLPRLGGALGLAAVGGTLSAQDQKGKGAIQKLKEIDSWLDDNIPFYGIAKWIAALSIGMWLLDLAFGFGSLLPRLGALGIGAMAGYLVRPNLLASPAVPFERARKEAARIAKDNLGARAEDVTFIGATASMPVRDDHWNYRFRVGDDEVLVMLSKGVTTMAGNYDSRVHVYRGAAKDETALPVREAEPLLGKIIGPEEALTGLRAAKPEFGPGAAVSFGLLDGDFVYTFYDDAGAVAVMDAAGGGVLSYKG